MMYVYVHPYQIHSLKIDLNLAVSIDQNKFSFLTAEVGRLKMEKSETPVKFCSERDMEPEVRKTSQYKHQLSLLI
jgi:hypothetical protein